MLTYWNDKILKIGVRLSAWGKVCRFIVGLVGWWLWVVGGKWICIPSILREFANGLDHVNLLVDVTQQLLGALDESIRFLPPLISLNPPTKFKLLTVIQLHQQSGLIDQWLRQSWIWIPCSWLPPLVLFLTSSCLLFLFNLILFVELADEAAHH